MLIGTSLVAGLASGCGETSRDASPVDFDALLETGTALYSQGKEELIARHFFRDERGGFFLDVGAYDWKKLSTTLYLEEKLGWRGIAVDANEQHAAGYAEHRPGTRFVAYLVSDRSGGEETFYVAEGASGVSSVERQWILDFFRDFFPRHRPPPIRPVSVPVITLDDLLAEFGAEQIDFLSIDIEGAELAALNGFSLERHRPRLACIEASKPNRESVRSYFAERGYERIEAYAKYDAINDYFRPARAAPGASPAPTPAPR